MSWIMNTISTSVQDLLTWSGLSRHNLVILVLVLLVTIYFITQAGKKKYKLAPGPFRVPLLGNLLQLSLSKLKAQQNFAQMTKTYGPVIRCNILGLEFIVLNDVSVVREALITKQDAFSNRPTFWTGELLSGGGKDILFGQPAPEWKYKRQIVLQAIRKYSAVENLEKLMRGINDNLTALIKEDEGPREAKPLAQFIAYNFAFGICFGKQCTPDDQALVTLKAFVQEFLEIFQGGVPADFMPSLAYCPLMWPQMRKIKNLSSHWKETLTKSINESRTAMQAGETGTIKDLTEYILAQQAEASDSEWTKQNLINDEFLFHVVSDVFGAGIDTITITLEWFLGYMAKYPDVQERLHQEIKAVFTSDTKLIDIRKKIPYVEAVLYEVMRMEPATPLGIPLLTGQDTSVGGYDVPKGCVVMLNIWAVHNNPVYWDKPEVFNPDRFLDEDGSLKHGLHHFIPFGLGRRQCIGEVVSKTALFMVIVQLFNRFEFKIPPDCPDWSLKSQDVPIVNYAVPFKLVIKER